MSTVRRTKPSKVAPSLVALGSAAVLTIYTAGYLRTRSASEQFESDGATRRTAAPPEAARAPVPAPPPALETPAAPGANDAASQVPAMARQEEAKAVTARNPTPAAATAIAVTPKPSEGPEPSDVAGIASVPASPTGGAAAETIAEPTPTAPTNPVPPAGPTPAEADARAPEPPAVQAAAARPSYKDGTYTGWGTSRHGDIEATVVVEGGRIASAAISRCLTRYSCSWIAMLPGQVVTRQSPEVDYVSGATQSTNAFYYAVVEALSKAK